MPDGVLGEVELMMEKIYAVLTVHSNKMILGHNFKTAQKPVFEKV